MSWKDEFKRVLGCNYHDQYKPPVALDKEWYQNLMSAFEYVITFDEFDHCTIVQQMLETYKKSAARDVTLNSKDGKVNLNVKKDASFNDLVEVAIRILVGRLFKDKCTFKIRAYLTARLGISFRRISNTDISKSPEMITLRRIAACFPALVVDSHKLGYGKDLYTADQMGFCTGSEVGGYFLTSFIAPCIPLQVYNELPTIRYLVLLAFVLSDNVRHPGGPTTKPILIRIFHFMKLSAQSKTPPESERNVFMKTRGLMNEEGVVHQDIITAAAEAKNRIQEARPRDHKWEIFVKEVEEHTFA